MEFLFYKIFIFKDSFPSDGTLELIEVVELLWKERGFLEIFSASFKADFFEKTSSADKSSRQM